MNSDPHRPLRLALRANAIFSGLCALALLVAPTAIGHTIGVPDALWLIALGIGLAAFAVHLLVTAARHEVRALRREALRHSLADFAWVAGSGGVLLGGWLTPAGQVALVAVGVAVLGLGVAQWRSLPTADAVAPGLPEST